MKSSQLNSSDPLVELYLILLDKGPGYGSQIEFWDPTAEALAELDDYIPQKLPLQ